MNAAGVPRGVYNVVNGFGPAAAGELLTTHPNIDAITFTGETRTGSGLDIALAYRVQAENTRLALGERGRVIGRKIGLTSKTVQAQLGVDRPDFGTLRADMCAGDSEEIA